MVHFHSLHQQIWQRRGCTAPDYLYQVPTDRHPLWVADIQAWFKWVARHLSGSGFTPHSVRRTGASAAFSILVPEAHIRNWDCWAPGSPALWRYIDRQQTPTHHDFRLFGWMVVPAEQVRAAVERVFCNN